MNEAREFIIPITQSSLCRPPVEPTNGFGEPEGRRRALEASHGIRCAKCSRREGEIL